MALTLTACGSSWTEPPPNPWAEEFAAAYAATDSEFIRRALADGIIDAGEFAEAQQRTIECHEEAGVSARFVRDRWDNLGLHMPAELTEEQIAASRQCEREWMGELWALHELIARNPANEVWDSLVVACLIRNELVPDGFTVAEYRELADQGTLHITADMTEEEIEAAHDAHDWSVQPVLPGGAYLNDGLASHCRMDPRI